MATTMEDKMKELCEDREFVENVCTTNDPEKVKRLFSEKGVEVDNDAAKAIISKTQEAASNEFTEKDLENVNGGFVGLTTIVACAIGGTVAGLIVGVYLTAAYKAAKYGK